MADWNNKMMDMKYNHGKTVHETIDEQDYKIKEKEIALKHPWTEAIVKLTDDGMIDIFADDQLGIRVDPNTKSVNMFGDTVNIIANNLNVRTRPYGFNWNGKVFNPSLYTDGEGKVMLQAKEKVRYSDGMIDIMQSMGLPVE